MEYLFIDQRRTIGCLRPTVLLANCTAKTGLTIQLKLLL